jgi:hypothetical protein
MLLFDDEAANGEIFAVHGDESEGTSERKT